MKTVFICWNKPDTDVTWITRRLVMRDTILTPESALVFNTHLINEGRWVKALSLCCRHTMWLSGEPLIFTRQTDSADCRIVSAAQNKPFILNREVSAARPLPITKHNIHSPTETTTPEDRSVDNTITWWGGCVRRTISSNHLRSFNHIRPGRKKKEM